MRTLGQRGLTPWEREIDGVINHLRVQVAAIVWINGPITPPTQISFPGIQLLKPQTSGGGLVKLSLVPRGDGCLEALAREQGVPTRSHLR